jgi:outer membrane protein assembly factor BamB
VGAPIDRTPNKELLMPRLFGIVAVVLACRPVAAADWPQWLGPNRDGASVEKIAPWKAAPKVLWRQPVGDGFSMPVVAGGRVVVHARVKDKEAEEVLAFDARTGNPLWTDHYDRAPYSNAIGTGPRATPAAVLNRVYTFGITGVLSCYQADSGKRLWQVDAYKQLQAPLPRFGVCCSPLVLGDRVLVGVGGTGSSVVAFDAEKGEVLWKALDEPASTSSPVLFAPRTQQAGALPHVVFQTTLRVVGLNPLDGSLAWEFPLVFQPAGASPTPVVADDLVLTSSITNGCVAVRLTDKDGMPTASRAWQNQELNSYFSSPVMAGQDHLYMVTNVVKPLPKATLRCIEVKSGKELWNRPGIGYFHAGLLRTGDNKLLVLDDSGTLKLLDTNATGYHELASAKVSGPTFVNPALANGRLYVRDNKELICLQLAE